jgi:hypothetical protein
VVTKQTHSSVESFGANFCTASPTIPWIKYPASAFVPKVPNTLHDHFGDPTSHIHKNNPYTINENPAENV